METFVNSAMLTSKWYSKIIPKLLEKEVEKTRLWLVPLPL